MLKTSRGGIFPVQFESVCCTRRHMMERVACGFLPRNALRAALTISHGSAEASLYVHPTPWRISAAM